MYRERIRSNPDWDEGSGRYGTVLVEVGDTEDGTPTIRGMEPAQVLLFFSFVYETDTIECAFIRWYTPIASTPDKETGMWIVEPETMHDQNPSLAVIPLNAVVRGVHLIPEFGHTQIPEDYDYRLSLDVFPSFYVNCYSDHHMFDLLKGPQQGWEYIVIINCQ